MPHALPLTMQHFPSQKLPITLDIMCNICLVCDSLAVIGAILSHFYTVFFFFASYARAIWLHPALSTLMPLATPCAVISLCSPAACWCALNEARCTKLPVNQPWSLSLPSLPGHCTDPGLPTLACCVQSTPARPMTHCSCHPTTALSLVVIYKEHCLAFLWHWGCPWPPSHCTGCGEGCIGSVSDWSRPHGPKSHGPVLKYLQVHQ